MKKYLFLFVIYLYSICLISCNNGENGEKKSSKDSTTTTNLATATAPDPCEGIGVIDDCENRGGLGNIIIDDATGKTMMGNFILTYRRDDNGNIIHALDSTYWVDVNTIFAIETFLKTTLDPVTKKPMYDGIRIHMACEVNPAGFPGQSYRNKTGLYIFPTKFRQNPPRGKSEHKDDKVKITMPAGSFSPYLENNSIAGPKINKFDEIYRRITMPGPQQKLAFSNSIWIDSCVVFVIAKLLRLPKANLDGVNINLAAYSNQDPQTRPSQEFANQSTVIIVPTSLKDGKHENNWDIVDCLYQHMVKILPLAPPGGFNHGELCPNKCD